jgi:hypothetical protein
MLTNKPPNFILIKKANKFIKLNSKTNKINKINKLTLIPNKTLYYDNLKFFQSQNNNQNQNNNNNIKAYNNIINKNNKIKKSIDENFTRNLDFIFNIGYNKTSELIEKNIPIFQLIKLMQNKKLLENIKIFYIDLLEAIETGDINIFNEILEENLKFNLLKDLVKFSNKNFSLRILNKNSPIDIKLLAFNEIFNVEINREKNIKTSDFILAPFKKNKFILANQATYKIKENKNIMEIENEKKIFFSSVFKEIANRHFLDSLKEKFKVEYCKLKLKKNSSDEDLMYLIKIMKNLDDCELKDDIYSVNLKNEFGDYYTLRERFYKEEKEKIELYTYFKENMPMKYKHFFEKNSQKSIIRNITSNLRRSIFEKIINPRKYILGKKSVWVIDLEISSKMRLDVIDENGDNVLNKYYRYKETYQNKNNNTNNNSNNPSLITEEDYDENYIFELPRNLLDLDDNENYIQKHTFRIELEKLNKRLFTSRLLYNTMKITDIDLALKGNRHVKILDENKLKI